MESQNRGNRTVPILRWIARAWSLLPILWGLAEIVFPHADESVPVPFAEWLLLGIFSFAMLSQLAAWRWEGLGAGLAIGSFLLFHVLFRVVRGEFMPAIVMLPMGFMIAPSLLFLTCWYLSRDATKHSLGEARNSTG